MMANKWLKTRADVLMRFANGFPKSVDKITLNIDKPDAGWIDMHFCVNGEEMVMIDTSDVYEPFLPLRKWLEFLITDWFETNASITLDLEGSRVTLSYEPILYGYKEDIDRDPFPRNCGIFTIYDSLIEKMVLIAFCDNLDFVSTLYFSLLTYVIKNAYDKAFIEEWEIGYNNGVNFETDEERSQYFVDLVKSPIIEDFYENKCQFELIKLKQKYRKQIDKKLAQYGFIEADINNYEMQQLINEIKCEEAGCAILIDGVLFGKSMYDRHKMKRSCKD